MNSWNRRNSIVWGRFLAAGALFAVGVSPVQAAPGDVLLTIPNPDGIVGSAFGDSLSVANGTILVGARNTPIDDVPFIGRAYAFDSATGEWQFTLHDPDAVERHQFGISTAIVGDQLLVGANNPPNGVYVFDRATGSYLRTLVSPKPASGGNYFGSALTPVGERALVSAPSQNVQNMQNAGEVFLVDVATGEVEMSFPNPDPTPSSIFSFSGSSAMGVADGKVFVGEFLDRGPDERIWGSVSVFDQASGDFLHKILNPDPTNLNDLSEWFGESLVASDEMLVVGVQSDSPSDVFQAGSAYVFDPVTGEQRLFIPNPDPGELDNFGEAIAVVGGDILVAARADSPGDIVQTGAAYLFDGWTGQLLLTIPNPSENPYEFFGWSVASLGNDLVIGAPYAEDGGRVYVIEGLPPRIEGDTNRDGVVDLNDLNAVRNNFGLQEVGLAADANRDGVVNLADLNAVRNHFGDGVMTVPEPPSGSLGILATTCLALAINYYSTRSCRQPTV